MRIKLLRQFLTIDKNEAILLPSSIKGLIEFDDMVVVLVGSDNVSSVNKLKGQNIYAFDECSKQLWQVAAPPETDGKVLPYSDINLNKKNELIAGTVRGTEYLINQKNGNVTPYNTGQRPW